MKKIFTILMLFIVSLFLFIGCDNGNDINGNDITGYGDLEGVIRDLNGNTLVQPAEVSIAGEEKTIEDGSFKFEDIEAGGQIIKVESEGYDDYEDAITINPDESNYIMIELESSLMDTLDEDLKPFEDGFEHQNIDLFMSAFTDDAKMDIVSPDGEEVTLEYDEIEEFFELVFEESNGNGNGEDNGAEGDLEEFQIKSVTDEFIIIWTKTDDVENEITLRKVDATWKIQRYSLDYS